MSNIYVYQHFGLGDFISCNGLIRSLLNQVKDNGNLHIFVPASYKDTISFMYRDEPKIKIITIDVGKKVHRIAGRRTEKIVKKEVKKTFNEVNKYFQSISDKNYKYIRISFDYYWPTYYLNPDKNAPWTCDMIFYKQMNIPYESRYTKCYWQRNMTEEERAFNELVQDKSKPFAFVHDEPQRGFIIEKENISSNLQIIRNSPNENLFNFGLILERASEIHVMESSFRNMLETLDTSNAKHYFYKFSHVPWGVLPYYHKEKNIYIGTSKSWVFRDLKEIKIKRNWFSRIFKF